MAAACADTLRDDGALCVFAHVYHLGTRVGLLVVVGYGHRIELGLRVVAAQDARGVLPSDGRTRFYLRPRQLGVYSAQVAALGNEVEHAAFSVFIARIPVLNGGVVHLGIVFNDDLNDGGMQLVFIAHGCRAAFKITYIGIVFGHNERAFELPGVASVNSEVRT